MLSAMLPAIQANIIVRIKLYHCHSPVISLSQPSDIIVTTKLVLHVAHAMGHANILQLALGCGACFKKSQRDPKL